MTELNARDSLTEHCTNGWEQHGGHTLHEIALACTHTGVIQGRRQGGNRVGGVLKKMEQELAGKKRGGGWGGGGGGGGSKPVLGGGYRVV